MYDIMVGTVDASGPRYVGRSESGTMPAASVWKYDRLTLIYDLTRVYDCTCF